MTVHIVTTGEYTQVLVSDVSPLFIPVHFVPGSASEGEIQLSAGNTTYATTVTVSGEPAPAAPKTAPTE